MSPSAVNTIASKPFGTYVTFSASTTVINLFKTCASVSFPNRTIAHRD